MFHLAFIYIEYGQALIPSPVVLDPILHQSNIQIQLGLGWP